LTTTAVIQAKQGIGDVMWHLPFIRAIAAATPGGKVTFLAPPTTQAAELLQAEGCIAQTLYFQHGGSDLRRGVNTIRLTGLLRRHRFQTVWILDRTLRPAVAAFLAGIPERIGLGLGLQSIFITNPGIDRSHFHDMPTGWLKALMAAKQVPFASTEPNLSLPASTVRAIGERYSALPRPWIVVGVGASHPDKDWSDHHWQAFAQSLRQTAPGTVIMIGGPANSERAARLIGSSTGAAAVNACDLSIGEAAALLRHSDVFIGTDSGPMNLAAAVGTPAFGLFGSTPVLDHSKFIHAILPDDGRGPSPGGMLRITPGNVMARIEPHLRGSSTAHSRASGDSGAAGSASGSGSAQEFYPRLVRGRDERS
jgi:heptosyltransferase-2